MKKKNKKLLIIIMLLAIAIGFALLSTTLNIIGTAGINKNTWNIHWNSESIEETEGSVTATTPAHVTDAEEKNIDFAVELELPGDFYEFTVDAINEGSIDGQIETIDVTFYEADGQTPIKEEDLPSEIIYSLKHADGSDIEENEVITKNGGTISYKLRVEFDKNIESLPTNSIVIKPEIKIVPVQHKKEEEPPVQTPMDEITEKLCFDETSIPADFWDDFDETEIDTIEQEGKTYVNLKSIAKVGRYLDEKGVYETKYTTTEPTVVFPEGIKSIVLPKGTFASEALGGYGYYDAGTVGQYGGYKYTIRDGKYYEQGYVNNYGDRDFGEMSRFDSVSVQGEGTIYMFATNRVPMTENNNCGASDGFAVTAYVYSDKPFRLEFDISNNEVYPLSSKYDIACKPQEVTTAVNGLYFKKLDSYRHDSYSCESGSIESGSYFQQSYRAYPDETLLTKVNPAYYSNSGNKINTISESITAELVKEALDAGTTTTTKGGVEGFTENNCCKHINWNSYDIELYNEFIGQYSDWEHITVGDYDTYYLLG